MPETRAVDAQVAAVMRDDKGRLLAALISVLGDFQLAEDALQEALAAALVHWRRNGAPAQPRHWLLRVAQRKAIDRLRRDANLARKAAQIAVLADEEAQVAEQPDIPDERLALIFACCHPALEPKTRVALTLRTLGGLSTAEIARAFLDRESAMAQRISRAKAKIAAAGIPFAVPGPELWPERLNSVLTVIYLVFNEGYSASGGDSPLRLSLCDEALWLARLVDVLCPAEPEIEGLLALVLLTHSRRSAREAADGSSVPLESQDRRCWDNAMRTEGEVVLDRAVARGRAGPYQLKAAISALHMADGRTDWRQIVLLYDTLLRYENTPVIRLNRAVALAECGGLQAALAELQALSKALDHYQAYHAARADLLRRDARAAEALGAYDRAIALCGNAADAAFLRRRRAQLRLH